MVYILFKILFFLHAALRRRWFKRFRINFPFRTPSKHTRRQWQKTGKWTREQNGLYSAHTDPARNKVKRTIYINYQNIHITETKASVCLSFKRLQWCMSFKADMWYIGYCAKGKKKKEEQYITMSFPDVQYSNKNCHYMMAGGFTSLFKV